MYHHIFMKTTSTDSPISHVRLQEIILDLGEENRKRKLENEYLKEQINLLTAQLYGRKSEKLGLADQIEGQLSFLEVQDETPEVEAKEETVQVPAHSRKKSGRKPLPENLPRTEVIHDIEDAEKECGCGAHLSRIGEEVSEQLSYIPAKLEVIRHIRPKYTCKSCEGLEGNGATVKIAPSPKQIIPKSIASSSLLAHIVTSKFVDSLPFYRQEKQFARLGFELSRTNMTNWTIRLGVILKRLLYLLHQDLLSGSLINIDETTIQVLKEAGRPPTSKSYMWVLRGGAPNSIGVYFYYSASRSGNVAQKLLNGYQGVVLSDGYAGYHFIDHTQGMEHAGCWAHSRRKFVEAVKAKGKRAKPGYAETAVSFISRLYAIEHQANEEKLFGKERVTKRQENSKLILKEFHQWLKEIEDRIPPKSLLGKAITYTLKRWEQLNLYLNHGNVPMDNNLAENAIRPFVIGRKNWLFCDTIAGAEANARLYSLIETAKANDLNPMEYLQILFEKLPHAENDDQLRRLLPQYINTNTSETSAEGVVN